MFEIDVIVAGIAAVAEDDLVLASAIGLAERHDAVLHLVHAFRLPSLLLDTEAGADLLDPAELKEHRGRIRVRIEERIRAHSQSITTEVHVVPGAADCVLLEMAERADADLLVLGATRQHTLASTILGSTAQRVLRGAGQPVLVVRARVSGAVRRILLTTDLSELSARVHRSALAAIDGLWGAGALELRSLLVIGYDDSFPPPLRRDLLNEVARRELESFLARQPQDAGAVTAAVRSGDPASEIVAEAAEWPADLLVLGTHGRPGSAHPMLGSVAEATLRNALCNVLVISR